MTDIRGLSTPLVRPEALAPTTSPGTTTGPSFQDLLKEKTGIQDLIPQQQLRFSNHAVERMASRGIRISEEDMNKIGNAVDRAAQKGAKDTLVLMGESAFIVNVKNKMVVTAMDRALMKENVFTNIDSTIVI